MTWHFARTVPFRPSLSTKRRSPVQLATLSPWHYSCWQETLYLVPPRTGRAIRPSPWLTVRQVLWQESEKGLCCLSGPINMRSLAVLSIHQALRRSNCFRNFAVRSAGMAGTRSHLRRIASYDNVWRSVSHACMHAVLGTCHSILGALGLDDGSDH